MLTPEFLTAVGIAAAIIAAWIVIADYIQD